LQSTAELVPYVRGNPGTVAQLVILRGTEELAFAIERAVLPLVDHYRLVDGRYGYLDLRHSTDAPTLRQAMEELDPNVRAWILDARGEVGPGDDVGAFIVGALARSRSWAVAVDRAGRERLVATDALGYTPARRPIVVLVDALSQLTALSVAAALHENGVARLIGEPTSRCAMSATPVRLPGGELSVRSAFIYTSVQRRDLREGVEPDELVARGSDGRDLPLEAAIAWFRTQAP
jgi:C-terminal processing protease CtpA/Prc